jgi:hypothetical protein
MKNLIIITFFSLVNCSGCYTNADFKSTDSISVMQPADPCEADTETTTKYNKLVDSLGYVLDFTKPFEEIRNTITIAKELDVIQKDTKCLIKQNAKLSEIKKSVLDLQASAEQLLKADSTNKDLQERVNFYKELASLIPNEP